MSKKVHPIILLLSKVSLPLMAALLLGYIYAIVVARSEFSLPAFVVLLILGAIAFGLIVKGIVISTPDPFDSKKSHETD